MYRYPRLFYWGLITASMSILFSKVIYDLFTVKPLIDPETLGAYIYVTFNLNHIIIKDRNFYRYLPFV